MLLIVKPVTFDPLYVCKSVTGSVAADAVVAVGRDSSAESPLGHAVMNAVAAAAAENLRIWPPGDAAVDTAGRT